MKKTKFLRGCLPLLAAVSILWTTGCPQPNNPTHKNSDPLAAPENLTLQPGDRQITASWTAVTGAEFYEVNYRTGGDTDGRTLETEKVSASLKSLTNGSPYMVKVRASNSKGLYSEWSEEKTATPVQGILSVPSGIFARASDQKIILSWDEVEGATGYEVCINDDEANLKPVAAPATTYEATGLTNGTEYRFKVRAKDTQANRMSEWSQMVTKTPSADAVDSLPPEESVSAVGLAAYEVIDITAWLGTDDPSSNPAPNAVETNVSGVMMIQWKPIPGALSYEVYVGDDIDARPATPAEEVTRTSFWLKNVTRNTTKYFWVRAKNEGGPGPWPLGPCELTLDKSTAIQSGGTTPAGGVERADYPKNLIVKAGSDRISLQWDKSDRAAWYEVYYADTDIAFSPTMIGEGWTESSNRMVPYKRMKTTTGGYKSLHESAIPWDEHNGAPGAEGSIHKIYACDAAITGLTAGSYYVWVRSLNHNGERGMAKAGPITVGTLPESPATCAVSHPAGIGAAITVTWTAVAGADSYKVYYGKYPVPDATTISIGVLPGETTRNILRLEENTLYYVWVTTIKNGLESAFRQPVSITTRPKTGNEPVSVTKLDSNGNRVINSVYIEVNETDPRVAMGYVLDNTDKTQYFDYVILFAANLRTRNCATDPDRNRSHFCSQNGPHVHLNGNVQHILDNRNKYIKPLQERGIKVLLGTLPDHDKFSYYSLGRWFGSGDYTAANLSSSYANWSSSYVSSASEYPFTLKARADFCEQLATVIEQYELDGFDIDDEWSELTVSRNDDIVAQNYAEFLYLMRQRLDRNTPDLANHPERRKIISVYWWNRAVTLTRTGVAMAESPAQQGFTLFDYSIPAGLNVGMVYDQWVDFSSAAAWPSFEGTPANLPASSWMPYAIDLRRTDPANITQINNMINHDPPYYGVTHYDLRSHQVRGNRAAQLSTYTQGFFNVDTIYDGPDYPQDWTKY